MTQYAMVTLLSQSYILLDRFVNTEQAIKQRQHYRLTNKRT